MAYLLDTCAWLHILLEPEVLSKPARDIISKEPTLHLSSVSLLEAAMLQRVGRISVKMDFTNWLETLALPQGRIKVHHITPAIAAHSQSLPAPFRKANGKLHTDPFDRTITATARELGFTLLTSDKVLLNYPHVKTLNSRK